ncbi:MAG: PQQ-binding-like beta-propeller repeat protein, partial [Planctomycetaceae bacterium]|nr:PQQ-binding-like beta-propeller repeat protein [Planctomycetaceae bacterium]
MPTNDTGQIPPGPGLLIRPLNSPVPAEPHQPGLLWGSLLALILWGPAVAALAAPPVEAPRPPAGSQTTESSRRAVPGLLWQLRLSRPADAPPPGSAEVEPSRHSTAAQQAEARQVAPEQLVTTSHLSPDGCLLAVGTAAGNVFLIETASGQVRDSPLSVRTVPLRQLPLSPDVAPESAPAGKPPAAGTTVRQVQFDRDQPGLLHVLSDRAILRWNTARPRTELVAVTPVPLVAPADRVDSDLRIARLLSADGRQVVITGGNAPQLVLSGNQLDHRREIAEPIEIDDCQTLPGTDALFASRFGRLYRWNLESGERAWKTRLEARIRGFAFNAPGTRIVALADYVGFQLVDPLTGNVLGQLPDPERRAGSGSESMAIAVSPDGTFFVRGAADGSLELWDHITGLR